MPPQLHMYSRSKKSSSATASLPTGALMKQAVTESVNTLLVVGGYIIVFCVIIRLLEHTGAINILGVIVTPLLLLLHIPTALATPFAAGLIEMTTGAKLLSSVAVPIAQKAAAISGIVSFSGLSIHSQATSFLSGTNISAGKYMLFKALHGVIAMVLSLLTAPFFALHEPAFAPITAAQPEAFGAVFLSSASLIAFAVFFLLFLCLIAAIVRVFMHEKTASH
ncbi:hypothetical protein LJB83_00245 [Clostridia bacterium OttesenSCG-928-F22]|nr:hypothetical protein [Clostridia bacterium OttesenSCG-928-F22]